MKKILVPTDFSGQSYVAIHFALQLAKQTEAEITILNVVEVPVISTINTPMDFMTIPYSYSKTDLNELESQSKSNLKHLIEDPEFLGVTVFTESITAFETSGLNLENYINDSKYDLVIMGSNGAEGLKEMIEGSNAEKIVRNATCPVLVLKNDNLVKKGIKKIVIPTDLAGFTDVAYKKINNFIKIFKSNVDLLYINTPEFFRSTSESNELLNEIKKNLDGNVNSVNYCSYNEEYGIINYVIDNKIDLVLMTSHGRKGINRVINGSIAEDLVNHADFPLLILKNS